MKNEQFFILMSEFATNHKNLILFAIAHAKSYHIIKYNLSCSMSTKHENFNNRLEHYDISYYGDFYYLFHLNKEDTYFIITHTHIQTQRVTAQTHESYHIYIYIYIYI